MKRAGFLGITLSLLTSIFFVFATDFVSARQDFIPETKSLAGQWVQVTSPTSQDLMGISMLSSTVGWAVGNNGTIVSWNGKNWYTENSPTSEDLFAVDFLSPSDGWAVGAGGTILHWNGDKWSRKSSPVSFWLNDIHMLSSSNGWIVGHGGTLLHWNGSNWSQASADYMPQIESVDMVSSSSGWAVGADIYMEMLRWNGSSWNSVNLSNINSRLKSVDMLSSSYGWAGGENGVMLRWNGSSWSQVGIPTDASIETIDMLSSTNGWSAGQYGEILHWNGRSWSFADSPLSSGWLFDMEMLSSDEGWAVGMDGVILRYGDERNADLRQAGEIQISGDLVEGGKVYLTFPVKNYGNAPSPPIHPYTEGYTSKSKLWRADGAQPTAVILDPGETVTFQVEHDLWYEHVGEWTTYGVYLWNDANNGYYVPLSSNGYDQQISFLVTRNVDLTVNKIDVFQILMAEKDPITNENIPLIEGKPTLVRVYVDIDGSASPSEISARLIYTNSFGTRQIINSPNSPLKSSSAPNLNNSLNFQIDYLWGDIDFAAEVDPDNRILEKDETNNFDYKSNVRFEQPKEKLRIYWTKIPYFHLGILPTSADSYIAIKGSNFMEKTYPFGFTDIEYEFQEGFVIPVSQKFTEDNAWNVYLKNLKIFWDRLDSQGGWRKGVKPDRLYGWIPNLARIPENICGMAHASWPNDKIYGDGNVAVGADYCDKPEDFEFSPERVLAHEIGHLLNEEGIKHTPNIKLNGYCFDKLDGTEPIYPDPLPRGSIGVFGIDPIENTTYNPYTSFDLMSKCEPPWISPFNYNKMFNEFYGQQSTTDKLYIPALDEKVMLVSGTVYSPSLSVEFDPFYVITSTVTSPASTGTDYCLETQDQNGVALDSRCFDLGFHETENDTTLSADFFSWILPYPPGTSKVVLNHLGTPLEGIEASDSIPYVNLTYPNGSEVWSSTGIYTATWTAYDLDDDILSYTLEYSSDSGNSWVPVGINITTTHQAIDMSELSGGTTSMLRISASDGFNTGFDVTDGTFTVGRKAPNAYIISPKSGEVWAPGKDYFLVGAGLDIEDGSLSDTSLVWTSNKEGTLGTGKQLMVSLSTGEHIITLTATDSDQNEMSTSIDIFVGHKVYLPFSTR